MTVAKERFSKLDKDNDGYASGPLIMVFFMQSLAYHVPWTEVRGS
uniref:EF-hand domain-containing protein n=1 Tax=Arundo donax TaxID=35708 RepID=A0A0A9E6L6_ARUDO